MLCTKIKRVHHWIFRCAVNEGTYIIGGRNKGVQILIRIRYLKNLWWPPGPISFLKLLGGHICWVAYPWGIYKAICGPIWLCKLFKGGISKGGSSAGERYHILLRYVKWNKKRRFLNLYNLGWRIFQKSCHIVFEMSRSTNFMQNTKKSFKTIAAD